MPYYLVRNDNQMMSIDRDIFKQKLQEQWPNTEVTETGLGLEWESQGNDSHILGILPEDADLISLQCNVESCAQFVLWFSSLHKDLGLLLIHDESPTQIEISSSLTFSELVELALNM
jgi:hypothetical protein